MCDVHEMYMKATLSEHCVRTSSRYSMCGVVGTPMACGGRVSCRNQIHYPVTSSNSSLVRWPVFVVLIACRV